MKIKWVLFILFAIMFFLTSCSGSGARNNMDNDNMPSYDRSESFGIQSNAPNTMAQADTTTTYELKDDSNVNGTFNDPSLKIIKNGKLFVETKDINNALITVTDKISKVNGYIQSLNSEKINVSLIARIPSDKFDGFMNESNEFGNIVSKSIFTEDISDTYFDTDARIKSLKIQEQRLLDLLSKGGDLKYLLEVENELARVRTEIEQLEGKIRYYDNKISYSTVEINIRETSDFTKQEEIPKSFGSKIKQTFFDGIGIVKSFFENIILILTYLLPISIIIAPVIFGIIVLVKFIRKKSGLKHKKDEKNDKKNVE